MTIEKLNIIMRNLKIKKIFGIVLIASPGIAAYLVSSLYPPLDALFLALIFGITFGTLIDNKEIKELAEKSLAVTLPVGITLYGANVKFPLPGDFPARVIVLTSISAILMGVAVYVFAKKFKIGEKLSLLLACGTAICGVSAVAIISPLIKPKKEEFSAAIIIITVVGLTGAILYPSLGYLLNIPSSSYAIMSGATLHQTGLVKIASMPFGYEVVQEALEIKGIRIAMITVVALVVSLLYAEHRFYIPWYVVGFLVVAFLSSFTLTPDIVKSIKPLSTIAFSITLASIGSAVNIRDIQNMRMSPLIAAYVGWSVSVAVILLLLRWAV